MTLALEVGYLCADVERVLKMMNIIVGHISRASTETYVIFLRGGRTSNANHERWRWRGIYKSAETSKSSLSAEHSVVVGGASAFLYWALSISAARGNNLKRTLP